MKRVSAVAALVTMLTLGRTTARAQAPSPEDQQVDQIRLLQTINTSDQERIREWVRIEVNKLKAQPATNRPNGFNIEAFNAFRERLLRQINDPDNTTAFETQFAAQTATVFAAEFNRGNLKVTTQTALARVLQDLKSAETVPALVVALNAQSQPARYLAAEGLSDLKSAISADSNRLDQVITALREAGTRESSPHVLRRIYDALAYPQHAAAVVEAYLAIFDARLAFRRGPAKKIDGAEYWALEFFVRPEVLGALSQEQKQDLVRRLAVFLRMDAERYNDPAVAPPAEPDAHDPGFEERTWAEDMLSLNEEILERIVGAGKGGDIREAFSEGGFANRARVLQEAYTWVGDPKSNAPGALNAAPWNVPIGAP